MKSNNVDEINSFLKLLVSGLETSAENETQSSGQTSEDTQGKDNDSDDKPPQVISHFWDTTELTDDEDVGVVNVNQLQYNTRSKKDQPPGEPSTTATDNSSTVKTKNQPANTKSAPSLELEYDLVEYLKKIRANISIYELLKLPVIRDKMMQGVPPSKNAKTSSNQNSAANTKDNSTNSSVNASSIGKKSNSSTPPFLLTFEICNHKVHNCMIDSGASKNVMPYSVCKKLNAVPMPCDTGIV